MDLFEWRGVSGIGTPRSRSSRSQHIWRSRGEPTLTSVQAFSIGIPSTVRQGFGNPIWEDWTQFLGLFAQDSWKITPRFTLDYGIRYDLDKEPKPLKTYNHVVPRVGFAWDRFGDQKTVIRAGGGIFYAPALYQVD